MDMKITTLEGKEAGSVTLPDAIFGLEPRTDIIQRCVNWQLAKRQRGTHKTKGRAEIWRTGKKMYAQKGTGGARHGSARVPQFRGGGRAFGPLVRSHAIDLPKKVRALALKHAVSSKAKDGGIIVLRTVGSSARARVSTMPTSSAPTRAPLTDPRPPITITTKVRISTLSPIPTWTARIGPAMAPANAANAAPNPKTRV